MKKQQLKTTIIIKSVIVFFLLAALFFVSTHFAKEDRKFFRKERVLKSLVLDLQNKIDSFNAKTKDITKALETWELLTAKQDKFEGIKISSAKEILDSLKEKYYFVDFEPKMSKPILLEEKYKGSAIAVESSNIKINLRAYSDVDVMLFLHDLSSNFPGYFKIDSYLIKLEQDIGQILPQVAKGREVTAVYAEIECSWREFKEL